LTESKLSNKDWLVETYKNELSREPDNEGMAYWIADMEERGQSREQVLSNIRLSEEYLWLQKQKSSD
tara:strand:+ start:10803 stop:11003 length:201 start_codon:yes stop_codon:yes gene_type:complete